MLRPKRRKKVVHREARCQPKRSNFIHDQLSNGQKFRALTVVDVFSREALAIEVGPVARNRRVAFPRTIIREKRSAMLDFETTAGSGQLATSIR